MLMPILTVKTSVTAAAQAAAVVETVTPRERTLPLPVRISGNQSDAVLKILETLNRHLVGSEPLPKEALIRLLDTLAKILKFPPLPQETLRDFSKRLAVFLETLPPAARLALEKQLGQRNLAVSIRILAEALKTPSIIDTPRLLDRLFTPPSVTRTVVGQPDGKPAAALPAPQGQTVVQGRQISLPATHALVAGPTIVPDPGLLQAALKKAFGDDDDLVPPVIAVEENETEQSTVTTPRRDDPPAKAPTAQPQQPAKAGSETIPLLRAAAAFLAADPEALSLVAAIATGDIDSRIKIELEQELGLDLSEQTEPMDMPEQPTQSEPRKPAEQPPLESRPASDIRASNGKELPTFANPPASRPDLPLPEDLPLAEDLPLPEIDAEPTRFFSAEPDVVAETTNTSARPPLLRTINEVDGFKGHDLGEWELEPESQSLASAEEAQPATFEPETDRPEKTLVQTLKALVEASLPLPGGAVDGPDTLFAALAGETADMGAETLFAQLEAANDASALPDTALLTGDIGDKAEPLGFEPDSWSALLDEPAEKTTNRQALAPPSTMDERTRETQTPRLADTGIARDAIPFAMIPYLPAKTQDTRTTKIEDEEQPAFAEDEDQGRREEGGDQPENHGDGEAAASQPEAEEPENDAGAAYDLYRRMGGLG